MVRMTRQWGKPALLGGGKQSVVLKPPTPSPERPYQKRRAQTGEGEKGEAARVQFSPSPHEPQRPK